MEHVTNDFRDLTSHHSIVASPPLSHPVEPLIVRLRCHDETQQLLDPADLIGWIVPALQDSCFRTMGQKSLSAAFNKEEHRLESFHSPKQHSFPSYYSEESHPRHQKTFQGPQQANSISNFLANRYSPCLSEIFHSRCQ